MVQRQCSVRNTIVNSSTKHGSGSFSTLQLYWPWTCSFAKNTPKETYFLSKHLSFTLSLEKITPHGLKLGRGGELGFEWAHVTYFQFMLPRLVKDLCSYVTFLLVNCGCTRVNCWAVKYRVDSTNFHVFSVIKGFFDMHRFSDLVFDVLVLHHSDFQRTRGS